MFKSVYLYLTFYKDLERTCEKREVKLILGRKNKIKKLNISVPKKNCLLKRIMMFVQFSLKI